MSSFVTFYDLLGIAPSDPGADNAAALLWPIDKVTQTQGIDALSLGDDRLAIVKFLQTALQFIHVRPGADGQVAVGGTTPGQITLQADLEVVSSDPELSNHTLYLSSMPDIGLRLMNTTVPARCYFARDGRGYEVIVENLPLHVTLKPDLITPPAGSPSQGTAAEFDNSQPDSFTIIQNAGGTGTELYMMARLHLMTTGDIILEASVPHSENSCVFLGLPAQAIYDLILIPSPNRIEYFEWARHAIDGFWATPPAMGALAFRSIDFDFSQPPFSDLSAWAKARTLYAPAIELVCEDVVVNLVSPIVALPLPSHGTFGFRKKVVDRTNLSEAFSLTDAPIRFVLYSSGGSGGTGGTNWLLTVSELLFQTGTPPTLMFQTAFVWQEVMGPSWAGTVAIADDWTVQLGVAADDQSPVKTTILDATIAVHALKLGLGLGRLSRGEAFSQSWQLLVDLAVTLPPSSGQHLLPFHLVSLTGKQVSTILRDVGWSMGRPSFTGLTMPDGAQLMFDNSKTVRLIIEEMAMVEDPDGINRFSFSGGIAIGFGGGDAIQPSGIPQENQSNGFGIRVRRLRFHPALPPDDWKCDGISLNIRYGPILVAGFGYITDDQFNGFDIHEMGFGAQMQMSIASNTFFLAAMFVKGTQTPIDTTSGTASFDYFLASLTVGELPVGAAGLYSLRALVAENFVPNLGTQTPDNKGLQLYLWHRDHDGSIDLPRDRNLADWQPQDHAIVAGAGAGLAITGLGALMHLDLFVLVEHTEGDTGIVAVGQAYLLKIKRPIAFAAIEYDTSTEQFSLMAGIEVAVADFLSAGGQVPWIPPSWAQDLATLSGTVYVGNSPVTFAIGQLSDQRTWLGLKVKFSAARLKGQFVCAVCVQYVDGGPYGFGIVLTISVGADWGFGAFSIFGSLSIAIGQWKTGSDAVGAEGSLQFGFKINLFKILSIGADITVKGSYLGKHPWSLSWSAQIRLDTPWWMPDVTFSIENSGPTPQPFDVPTSNRGLAAPSAIAPSSQANTPLLAPPLSDGVTDTSEVYTFNELTALVGVTLGDTHGRSDLPIVGTDATVAINFTNPVSNDMAVAPDTYGALGDAGVQQVQDLTLRYGLQSIAVRRSPRFGPDTGTWTDFVTASQTALDLSGGQLQAAPALSFQWDVDVRANGTLSPTRLLLNGSTPFTFTIGSAQNDEEAVHNDAGYPCCPNALKRHGGMLVHSLTFANDRAGMRLPRSEQFSLDGGWWQWTNTPTPLAAPPLTAQSGAPTVARLSIAAVGTLGRIDFADPAMIFTINLTSIVGVATLVVEGYSGVNLAAQLRLQANAAGSGTQQIKATVDAPFTYVILRAETVAQITGAAFAGPATAQISELSYVTSADYIAWQGAGIRCQNSSGSSAAGKLAFLPNTDYEVTVTTEIRLEHSSQGTRALTLSEPLYFRTKGLPGLNSVANVGDEILPYVESTYPRSRLIPLYREEPIALAFTEGLSTLLPVDRIPAPTDPPEKTQIMEIVLNIDRVVSTDGLQRLTVPTNDWITAHRAGPPRLGWIPIGVDATLADSPVRSAPSLDPLVVRYQAVLASTVTCQSDSVPASQLLRHMPIAADGTPGAWQPTTGFRATVRAKDGPYTDRSEFDTYDAGAFISQCDGTDAPAGRWSISSSAQLVAPAAGNGRQYASFGDLTWNHLQLHAVIMPNGVSAGIAVGVAGGNPVPQAVLATIEPDGNGLSLVLRARAGDAETELGRTAIDATSIQSNGAINLIVTAFDDTVRAQVGGAQVEGQRGAIRDGRVALVAQGPAAFVGVAVDGLDQYRYDFVTSSYQSFEEHLDSFDGSLAALPTGAAGGTPASVATVLSANATAIPNAMQSTADPQLRQALATNVVNALAIPLRQRRDRVTIDRLVEQGVSVGFLIESPEPLTLSTDVTITLVRHVNVHHWPPLQVGGDSGVFADALSRIRLDANAVSLPLRDAKTFQGGDRIIVVRRTGPVPTYAIYDAPLRIAGAVRAVGKLRETVAPTPGIRPELDAIGNLTNDGVVALRPSQGILGTGGLLDGGHGGHGPVTISGVPVSLTALTNGDETTALLFSVDNTGKSEPMPSGNYTLTFQLQRQRWRTAAADPDAVYDQTQFFDFSW